jgi:hypothetical protein
MMNKIIVSFALVLSSLLALCWYPLGIISKTHLVNTQILFYAFASAALLTVPLLFIQASRWRPQAPLLVCFAVISSLANTLLQYSLLEGDTLAVISVFCMVLSCLLLFSKTELNITFNYIVNLSVVLSAILMLFFLGEGLRDHWTEWASAAVALLFFLLLRLDKYMTTIPLGSKLSVSLIGSTWIIGMVTIFSERFSSYIQDNAVSFSIIYGLLCLMPITAATLYLLSSRRAGYILLWPSLMLVISLISVFLNKEVTILSALL